MPLTHHHPFCPHTRPPETAPDAPSLVSPSTRSEMRRWRLPIHHSDAFRSTFSTAKYSIFRFHISEHFDCTITAVTSSKYSQRISTTFSITSQHRQSMSSFSDSNLLALSPSMYDELRSSSNNLYWIHEVKFQGNRQPKCHFLHLVS